MLEITATEFKTNLGKYLKLLSSEDIFVTKNGKYIARLTNPNVSPVESLSGILKGKIPDNIDRHSLREERILQYEADD